MRALIVDGAGNGDRLAARLDAAGIEVVFPGAGLLPAGPDSVGRLAEAMLDLEATLNERRPDAVLLASASELALAMVIVATKQRIPVASVGNGTPSADRASEINRILVERLADATLANDGAAVSWLEGNLESAS